MRERTILALAGAVSMSALVLLILAGGALGQTDPPSTGDWVVADTTVVSDQTVDLHGNLLVTSTGMLTLESVNLRIHLSSDGEHGIEVQTGGTLHITDGDDDPDTTGDASVVTAVPNTRSYFWINNGGCTLRVFNSQITRCGYVPSVGPTRLGVYIATGDATIVGTSIDDNLHGIVLDHATITVTDSSITNCTYHGVNAQDSILTFTGCTMADNGYEGARIVRGDATMTDCVIVNNRNGLVARTGANVTLADSLVRGNTDGILGQIDAHLVVDNCTVRAQTQYGIHMEDRGTLEVIGTVVMGSSRTGLYAYNRITVTSSGSTYRNNVYGAQFNTQCTIRSTDDTYTRNTNSGVYLEDTADLVIMGGLVTDNSAGVKAEGGSSIVSWDTTVSDCDFEGYLLTNADLELHDGAIVNCTGGGIVPDPDSTSEWTVHPGNSSTLQDADVTITENFWVHGDLTLRGSNVHLRVQQGVTVDDGFVCDGGAQDWQNASFRPDQPGDDCVLRIEGTATGAAWFLTIQGLTGGWPVVQTAFEFHRCTFRDSEYGLVVGSEGVVLDRCTFIDNGMGADVAGVEVRFENCTFQSTGPTDVRARDEGGHAVMVNSTFDPAKVVLATAEDRWSAWWVVHVHAEFPSGYAAPGAVVEIRDSGDNLVFSGTTNGVGDIYGVLVLEHTTDSSGKDARTPHNFSATLGSSHVDGPVDVTGHMRVNLVLADPDPPVLNVTSHSDGDHVRTRTLVLQGTATDEGSSVYRVEASVATQSWELATGTDAWEWSHTFSADGTYPLRVRARDYALSEVVVYLNITVDTEPPDIELQVPPTPGNNSVVGSAEVTLKGWVDKAETVVTAMNVTADMVGTEFYLNLTLVDGLNVITIRAVDKAGNSASLVWHLQADLDAPPLTVFRPVDGSLHNTTSVLVEGQTSPFIQVFYRVLEDDTSWSMVPDVSATGVFSFTARDLVQGTNHLEVMVMDSAENRAVVAIVITVDTVPASLDSAIPSDGSYTRFPWLNLTGAFNEPVASMNIGTHQADIDGANFSIDVPLLDGSNYVTMAVTDLAGNTAIINLRYFLDTILPTLSVQGLRWNETAEAFDPVNTNRKFYQLIGTTETGAKVFIDAWEYDVDENGGFVADLELENGTNTLEVLVRDLAGNELLTTVTLVLDIVFPELTVDRPVDRHTTKKDFVWVEGTITPGDRVTIGSQTMVSSNGTFRMKVRLDEAVNRIVIVGSDLAGNEVSIERLVFVSDATEGLTGNPFLDDNCTSLLVLLFIATVVLGVIIGFAWRGEDVVDRREKALEAVMEEDAINLDKPHLEPSSGFLQYDPTSPTGRKPEFEEREDEEFVSMAEFRRQMDEDGEEGGGGGAY